MLNFNNTGVRLVMFKEYSGAVDAELDCGVSEGPLVGEFDDKGTNEGFRFGLNVSLVVGVTEGSDEGLDITVETKEVGWDWVTAGAKVGLKFRLGAKVGINDGITEGSHVPIADGTNVGAVEGIVINLKTEIPAGLKEGILIGSEVFDGLFVGTPVGLIEGMFVGFFDGLSVGRPDGFVEGKFVGVFDGL